eukprot:s629_g14.t1
MGYRRESTEGGAGYPNRATVPDQRGTGSRVWAWFNRGVLPPRKAHGQICSIGKQHLQQNLAALRLSLDAKHNCAMGRKPTLFAGYNIVLRDTQRGPSQAATAAAPLEGRGTSKSRYQVQTGIGGSRQRRRGCWCSRGAQGQLLLRDECRLADAQETRRGCTNKGEFPFPLRTELVLKVAATLRKAGFASADQYLGSLKLIHLELDYELRPALKSAYDQCKRDLARDQGPPERAPEVQLGDFPEQHPRHDLVAGQLAFPFLAYGAALVFMLRIDELFKLNWEDAKSLQYKVGIPEGKMPVAAITEGIRVSKASIATARSRAAGMKVQGKRQLEIILIYWTIQNPEEERIFLEVPARPPDGLSSRLVLLKRLQDKRDEERMHKANLVIPDEIMIYFFEHAQWSTERQANLTAQHASDRISKHKNDNSALRCLSLVPLQQVHQAPYHPMLPRFQWIAENVASAFGREEENQIRKVESLIQENLNYKKLTEFLEGRTKQQHIFFFYQRPDATNEHNEIIDADKDCKFTITTGENERIKSLAVYFLRNVPQDRAIKTDVFSDQELLFGEVTPNPLESLSTTLATVFRPIAARQEANWGQCDEEQKIDFLTNFEKFTVELSESISALSGGIVLQKDLPSGIWLDPASPQYQVLCKNSKT